MLCKLKGWKVNQEDNLISFVSLLSFSLLRFPDVPEMSILNLDR